MATSVLVSGANGFVAQHIVKLLISKGYKVVGTVRSAQKGEALKANLNSENFTYEVVPELTTKGAFDETLKAHPEVTVFLHTASPVRFDVTDLEKELLTPAIEGTKNALSAVQKFGPQIKNVVITSSYAAVFDLALEGVKGTVFTEDSWNPTTFEGAKSDLLSAYSGGKTFAEKASWDFVKNENPNFTLTTVLPVYVFGPQAFDSEVKDTLNLSAEVINSLLKLKKNDDLPPTLGKYIDARDVARAHVAAFEQKNAAGKRLLLAEGKFSSQAIIDILHDKFASELGDRLPLGVPGSDAKLNAETADIDSSKTKQILDFKYRDLETTVYDTIKQIYDVNGKL